MQFLTERIYLYHISVSKKNTPSLKGENKNQSTLQGGGQIFFSHPYKIIFLVCVLLHAQILTFGLVHFDDHGFVLLAADELKLSHIADFFKHSVFWVMGDTKQENDIYYRPLQNVVYAICNTISTKQPWIYHFVGLSLHILTSIALFKFFCELKYHKSISLAFTLIYSVHPVLVQGVAWIAGVGDQMAAIFSLLSVVYFIKTISPNPEGSNNSLRPLGLGLLHFLFFTGALFSKEISVMIIPLCLLYWVLVSKIKIGKNEALLFSSGWIAIMIVFFIFRTHAITAAQSGSLSSAIDSFKMNGLLIFEYVEKIFFPYRLCPTPSRDDAHVLPGAIIFLVIVSFLIFKKRVTRLSVFGAFLFFAFLLPTFLQINPQTPFYPFEHRLYLPLIGILIVIMEFVKEKLNPNSKYYQYGFLILFITLFATTFSYSRTFKNVHSFYDRVFFISPKSVLAYNAYAGELLEEKKYSDAVEAYKKSFLYEPKDTHTSGKIADIYLNNLNNPQEAIAWFKKTLDINPNSVEAAVNIADAYFNFLHDTTNAQLWYNNAVKINPGNEFALANLGVIYAYKGKKDEARKFFSKSLQANPKNLFALKWMAILFFNEGKISEAVNELNKAFENYPNDIDLQRNLMICYYKMNDFSNTEKFASLYSKSNNPLPAEIENYLQSKR